MPLIDNFFVWEQFDAAFPQVVVALNILIALLTSSHVILHKTDTHAAIAWVGLIWLVPFIGTLLYLFLGINRIHRRARDLKSEEICSRSTLQRPTTYPQDHIQTVKTHLHELIRVGNHITHHPLVGGNQIEPLIGGNQAYPAMLDAITQAKHSISLESYIFEATGIGQNFVRALADAQNRGVKTRVLIDDVGARYSRPRIHKVLRHHKVRTALFLPALLPRGFTHFNLRSHRKILVVDGKIGFTGGMNIRQACILQSSPPYPTQDVHFRVDGPVVAQLQEAFVEDWAFTTREQLEGPLWFPPLSAAGDMLARGVIDGPDKDIGNLHWMLMSALITARHSIRLMTPYFLPDDVIIQTLHIAAMRGIKVDIVVPEKGNLPIVRWAQSSQYSLVLGHGCRLWLTPPPFEHTKLFVIDGAWSFVGSGNWDPRSLRLNFEFNLEIFDEKFATTLEQYIQARIAEARLLTKEELQSQSVPLRLRNGIARLLKPYL